MTCPDLDRLMDFHLGASDPELRDHLRTCPSCKADMGLLYLLPAASYTQEEIPERLVRLAIDALLAAEENPSPPRVTLGQKLVTGFIGALTAAAGLVITGSPGEGGPIPLLLLSALMGLVAGALGNSKIHHLKDAGA